MTPSSKVVGDLAIYMMTHHLTPEELLAKAKAGADFEAKTHGAALHSRGVMPMG